MNETFVTVQGNVATPLRSGLSRQGTPYASFRLACTLRRNTDEGWRDVATSFYQVSCYRSLAEHAVASLQVGQPVVVYGKQLVKQWDNGERKGTDVEIDAVSVGHDLCRGTSMFAARRRLTAVPAQSAEESQPAAEAGSVVEGAADRPAGVA